MSAIFAFLGKLLEFLLGVQANTKSADLKKSEEDNAKLRREVLEAKLGTAARDAAGTASSPKVVEEKVKQMSPPASKSADKPGVVEVYDPNKAWKQ